MLAALSLKDFTINNIFSSLNLVQVVLFFVVMVFVLLFGLMLGGVIFYPMGIKNYLKKNPEGRKEYYKKEEEKLEAQMQAMDAPKPKKVVSLDFSEEEFDLDELELEDELEFTDFVKPTENSAKYDAFDVVPISIGEKKEEQKAEVVKEEPQKVDPMSVLDDPDFAALVNNRKKEVPVLTRRYVLKYVNSLDPISDTETISLTTRTPEEPFDTAFVGAYPFLVMYSIKRVLKLFIRLHPTVYEKIRGAEGNLIAPAPEFGYDWYGWTLTDDGKLALPPKAILSSYKYTVSKEYKKGDDGVVIAIGEPYADELKERVKKYNPLLDETYKSVIKELVGRYDLEVFGSTEACNYTRGIKSEKSTPSAMEFLGNRPSILKTDDHIFGIVFENFGVIKFIFRNSEEFVKELSSKHEYVKESPYPNSRDWKWYSLLLDPSYTKEEIQDIILSCFKYVEDYHSEYLISDSGENAE